MWLDNLTGIPLSALFWLRHNSLNSLKLSTAKEAPLGLALPRLPLLTATVLLHLLRFAMSTSRPLSRRRLARASAMVTTMLLPLQWRREGDHGSRKPPLPAALSSVLEHRNRPLFSQSSASRNLLMLSHIHTHFECHCYAFS